MRIAQKTRVFVKVFGPPRGLKAWKDEDLNLTLLNGGLKMNFERLNKKQVKNWKRQEMKVLVKELGFNEVKKEGY